MDSGCNAGGPRGHVALALAYVEKFSSIKGTRGACRECVLWFGRLDFGTGQARLTVERRGAESGCHLLARETSVLWPFQFHTSVARLAVALLVTLSRRG